MTDEFFSTFEAPAFKRANVRETVLDELEAIIEYVRVVVGSLLQVLVNGVASVNELVLIVVFVLRPMRLHALKSAAVRSQSSCRNQCRSEILRT